MTKSALVLAAALPLAIALHPAQAQQLETGKWTGVVTWVSGAPQRADATYEVSAAADTTAIKINLIGAAIYTAKDVKLSGKTLTFWLTAGSRVNCSFQRREDNAFEGDCKSEKGVTYHMVMLPPKKS